MISIATHATTLKQIQVFSGCTRSSPGNTQSEALQKDIHVATGDSISLTLVGDDTSRVDILTGPLRVLRSCPRLIVGECLLAALTSRAGDAHAAPPGRADGATSKAAQRVMLQPRKVCGPL